MTIQDLMRFSQLRSLENKLREEFILIASNNSQQNKRISYDLDIAGQVLICEYLGLLDDPKLTNNTLKAKFVQNKFQTVGFQNHRIVLSNTLKARRNLKRLLKIINLLEKQNEFEALKRARSDLQKYFPDKL